MPVSAQDLARLANDSEVIVVRNNLDTWMVFSDPNTKTSVTFSPSTFKDGENVQQVSASLLRNPSFLRTIAQNILSIEEAPEALQEAVDQQAAAWQQRQDARADTASLAQKASDKIVGRGVQCIAPGPGGEICGSYTLAMGKNPQEKPPLCPEHIGLAPQYAYVETDIVGPDGKPEGVWRRASLIRTRG
jgi:hypothetical protein